MTDNTQDALRKAVETLKRIVAGEDDAWKFADNIISNAEAALAQPAQPTDAIKTWEQRMSAGESFQIPAMHAEIKELRAALSAAPAANEPIGKILSESEMPISYDRRAGNVFWWGKPKGPAMLYSAPLDAKAIEQRGYVRAIEDALGILSEEGWLGTSNLRIRALINRGNQDGKIQSS